MNTDMRYFVLPAIFLSAIVLFDQGGIVSAQADYTRPLIASKEPALVAAGDSVRPFVESDFVPVTKVNEMPQSVRNALGGLLISDAGGPFNAGCMVDSSKPVPMTRLIFAAVSKSKCVMHYEQGGIAHIFKVSCYSLESTGSKPLNSARLLWQTNLGNSKLSSLADLNKLIKAGNLQITLAKQD